MIAYEQDPVVGGLVPNSLAVLNCSEDGGGKQIFRINGNVIGSDVVRRLVNMKGVSLGNEPLDGGRRDGRGPTVPSP